MHVVLKLLSDLVVLFWFFLIFIGNVIKNSDYLNSHLHFGTRLLNMWICVMGHF